MHSRALLVGAILMFGILRAVFAKDVVHSPSTQPAAAAASAVASPLDFAMKDIDGNDVKLADYKGKVVLLVNVASRCGFTPQYEGLEKLYESYRDQGLVIIGIPANNFGGQEPGSNEEIKTFCTSKYKVSFPMLAKISVKGDDKHPLYKFLTEKETNGDFAGEIGWNFTKFLIDRNGQVMARFESKTKPEDAKVTKAIEAALGAK